MNECKKKLTSTVSKFDKINEMLKAYDTKANEILADAIEGIKNVNE